MKSVKSMWLLLIVVAFLYGTTVCKASNSRPPRNNDISNIADALKYLQDLDSYYGDKARVRFGKRTPISPHFRNHMHEYSDTNQRIFEAPVVDEPF